MATKKKKAQEFYFKKNIDDGYVVIKFVEKSDGVFEKEAEHFIIGGRCDCQGFQFRGDCRHKKMLDKEVVGEIISLDEARRVAHQILKDFHHLFRVVKLADEPYTRDSEGNVLCITVCLAQPMVESKIMSAGSGAWESCYKDTGVKVRLVIS